VQTTLLSIAIALIVALLAALLGPQCHSLERSSRLLRGRSEPPGRNQGQGRRRHRRRATADPSVTLRAIAIGPVGEGSRLRARSLRIELGLGPLMRGELRATEMRLVAPQFNLGLDGNGQIDWPPLALANETLSIDRLRIEDGRATLTDVASKSRLVLDQLWFTGDVRSLTGPIRGKGEFVTGGGLYGYEISVGRGGPEGVRLNLSLKTDERPLTVETDGLLTLERGGPRFEGALALSRPAGAVLAGGKAVAFEPWRLASKVKADVSAAALDEGVLSIRPGRARVDLDRFGRVQVRRAAAIAGYALGAAGRSRPAAGDTRGAAPPAARGGAGVWRDAR
jgi:large subunit ribosomal protein L24